MNERPWFSAAGTKWNGQVHRTPGTRNQRQWMDQQWRYGHLKHQTWKHHDDSLKACCLRLALKSRNIDSNTEQTRNNTANILVISWIVSGTNTYPSGHKQGKYTTILTNLKNQMKHSELHSCHVIYAQISIVSFLLKESFPSVTELNTEANP